MKKTLAAEQQLDENSSDAADALALKNRDRGIFMNELTETGVVPESLWAMRELASEEVTVVAGGHVPADNFCHNPTGPQRGLIRFWRFLGYSDSQIARMFYS